MKKQLGVTVALSIGLLASHAALANDAVIGALLGGGAGVVVGHSVGGGDGAIIGGALGAAAGAAIASQYDRPRVSYGPPAYTTYQAPRAYYPQPVHYAPPAYYPRPVYYAPPAYYPRPVIYAAPAYYQRPAHYARGERWTREHRDYDRHNDRDYWRDDHRR